MGLFSVYRAYIVCENDYMLFQGITVKIDETGDLTIARIMAGSMSDKLGELISVNVMKSLLP